MGATINSAARLCRAVTPEEVAHYQDNGWVRLKAFIDPEVIRGLLVVAKEKMGLDGDSNTRAGGGVSYFNPEKGGGLSHPMMRPLIEQVGQNAKLLMARGSDVGVRYYQDNFIPKLPLGKKTVHGGNSRTSYHQDFCTDPTDRSGGMTFWIPLEDYGPEAGTLSFLNGSHRMGVFGGFMTYGDGDARDAFPHLKALTVSEPLTVSVGDVTVHSDLTVHGARANQTELPRWAYMIIVKPADIRWNGAPWPTFDPTHMKPWDPFGDQLPVIA